MKEITVICGHYGSGKTNLSVNLALRFAKAGKKTAVCDLDIVNPYFRLADFKDIFDEYGIVNVAPKFANTSLDLPSLDFDMEVLIDSSDHLIIDVGGDDSGAVALGRYSKMLNEFEGKLEVLYVINKYRYVDYGENEALSLIYDIENAARIKVTGIVNNSNLGKETTSETVKNSLEYAKDIAAKSGLPLVLTTYPAGVEKPCEEALEVEVFVKPIWEKY